jgi:hypothetical protein
MKVKSLIVTEAEVNELMHGLMSYPKNVISSKLLDKLEILWKAFQELEEK